jgi:DNA-directed RNA polymerase subunit omega
MSPELVDKALKLVGNPNVLINLVSRRVRQLNSGNRPMLVVPVTMGTADVALTEIVEKKLAWEVAELDAEMNKKPKRRKRSSS